MTEATIYSWLRQDRVDKGEIAGLTTDQTIELVLLGAGRLSTMPIGLITIPDHEREDFLDALRKLDLVDGELVEDVPDNPGTVGINFAYSSNPQMAAERIGQVVDGANEVAGRVFHAVAGGAYWPQSGETL
jgi:hypothetical protein